MTTTSQVRSVINDLYDALGGRFGAGTAVFRYTPSPRDIENAREYLSIANAITNGTQTYPFLTTTIKDEAFDLNGQIIVAIAGAGDEVAEQAMDRAEAIAAELETALQRDPTLGRAQQTDTVEYAGHEHRFGGDDQNRMHQLDFTIHCSVRLISS